ncbi:hypothetical protein J0H58_33720 [bacterium]|nr:hypothetical protein [bacterium]
MKHCRSWMLLVCLAALGLLVLSPMFGASVAGAGALFGLLLMLACCVLPMTLLFLPRNDAAGCCKAKGDDPSAAKPDGRSQDEKSSGCH